MNTLLDEATDEGKKSSKRGVTTVRDLSDKIAYAFQLATAYGPLCQEPMQGVAVILEEITIAPLQPDEVAASDAIARLSSEVIRTMRESIKQGFLDWSPRILLAMYSCEIQTSSKFPCALLRRNMC